MASKNVLVLFLGPPGVGKGTYARRAASRLGMTHVSAGELLRSSGGAEIQQRLKAGHLVPEEVIFRLMKTRLEGIKGGAIVDGFPRSAAQARGWFKSGGTAPELAVLFSMREDVLVGKLMGREICAECGDMYNAFGFVQEGYSLPAISPRKRGICDTCGGNLVKRSDDNAETIRNRLELHRQEEGALIDVLGNKIMHVVMKKGIADIEELVRAIKQKVG